MKGSIVAELINRKIPQCVDINSEIFPCIKTLNLSPWTSLDKLPNYVSNQSENYEGYTTAEIKVKETYIRVNVELYQIR
jgi:hypothetical protein